MADMKEYMASQDRGPTFSDAEVLDSITPTSPKPEERADI